MYTALLATSQTLEDFLQSALENDPNLRALFNARAGGNMAVSLRNPEEMTEKNDQGLSLWLYKITRDEDRLNDPPERISPDLLHQPPLPPRLHYLLTPVVDPGVANNAEIEQRVLGKVLQVLYGHPLFQGADLARLHRHTGATADAPRAHEPRGHHPYLERSRTAIPPLGFV